MDTTYTITEMMSSTYHMLKDEWAVHGSTANLTFTILAILKEESQLTIEDGVAVASIALGFTILRYLIAAFIFQVQFRTFSLMSFVNSSKLN